MSSDKNDFRRKFCRIALLVLCGGVLLIPSRQIQASDVTASDHEDAIVVASDLAPIPLAGHWSGNWYSCTTGHQGPLFGQFCQLSTGDYQVNFRGRFFKILPFRYSVVLRVVEQRDGVVYLRGQSYLGRLFGTFTYEATATECEFRAHYRSCDDYGTFSLKRCCH